VSGSDGRACIELPRVDRVEVSLVAGDLLVSATPGPSRVEIEWLGGPEVRVSEHEGVLVVRQEAWPWPGIGSLPRAAVAVQCPPGASVQASTVKASTVVAGMAGEVRTATVSGPVTFSYVGGDVRARTVSAPVEMEGVSGRLQVATVSGSVELAGGRLADLRASSASGDVYLDLELLPSGTYRCSTVSGDLALRVPEEVGADVEACSVSGRLDVGGHPVRRGGRGMHAHIGEAAADSPRILLRTVSGRMTVLPRPATADSGGARTGVVAV
jgi:hypothetical protein